ncbi:hypothetical protein AMJ87_05435 [candidate division WOR_3 bacterium SM23_60]|uniref:HAMP domain-containing protein n=1 Tax=candidate division WOR_3 bacterium SM23_60 TaxID=1703780 RepID=A0A0S8GGS1_UNCW3|nr:MAG: hypothetical protein AMJ87_05435 [candidate division WOR_3 bacterium SM23_60]
MQYAYRRKRVILHGIQVKLIVALLGIVAAVAIVLVGESFIILRNNAFAQKVPPELIDSLTRQSLWPVVITGIVLLIASLWALILATHKIYGPLYRLRVYIKKLCDGEPTDELRFRRGDAMHGLKEIYNDLRKSLEKTLHYDYGEMVEVFSELQQILDKVYANELKEKELSDSLQHICDRLAKALDKTSEAIEKE